MGRVRLGWRTWAVLCIQVAIVTAETIQEVKEHNRSLGSVEEDVHSDIEARGKKKKKLKYLLVFLLGAIVVKGVIIPIALKALALLAGKAFLLSSLSLILSAIIGFRQISSHTWDRMGEIIMKDRGEVTEVYHPIPTEPMYLHSISRNQWERDLNPTR